MRKRAACPFRRRGLLTRLPSCLPASPAALGSMLEKPFLPRQLKAYFCHLCPASAFCHRTGTNSRPVASPLWPQGGDPQPNGYVFDGIDAGSLNSGASARLSRCAALWKRRRRLHAVAPACSARATACAGGEGGPVAAPPVPAQPWAFLTFGWKQPRRSSLAPWLPCCQHPAPH